MPFRVSQENIQARDACIASCTQCIKLAHSCLASLMQQNGTLELIAEQLITALHNCIDACRKCTRACQMHIEQCTDNECNALCAESVRACALCIKACQDCLGYCKDGIAQQHAPYLIKCIDACTACTEVSKNL